MRIREQFTTPPEPCPYLADRPYRLDVRFVGELSPQEYQDELARGARRFGAAVFEPACQNCRECVPIRIRVDEFRASKSQRRVFRKNRDLEMEIGEPTVNEERLALYREFHRERHQKRGWPEPEVDALVYFTTFVDNPVSTVEFRYKLGGRLVAVAYVDQCPDALNSIYAFTDPQLGKRSLGTLDVLVEIEEARRQGKEFLYLGFHVEGCSSMEYKRSFRPYELRLNGKWTRNTSDTS